MRAVASNDGAIRTKEVPGLNVYGNVPHTEQSSDTDNDTEAEHGNQRNALAEGDLDGCEVFRRPKEDED
jgi:hypothetical protein